MTGNDASTAVVVIISSTLSLLGLWYLFFYQYVDYRRDVLRSKLFSIRAELFDAAAGGLIPFDHPAYGQLRRMINGFLRFGHRVGSLTLLGCALVRRPDDAVEPSFEARWAEARTTLDPEVQERLEDFRKRVFWAFLEHLVATSALLMMPVIAVCLLVTRLRNLRRDGPSWTNRIESAAFAGADSGPLRKVA